LRFEFSNLNEQNPSSVFPLPEKVSFFLSQQRSISFSIPMGVKNLWDLLESCKKRVPLHRLQCVQFPQNSVFSLWTVFEVDAGLCFVGQEQEGVRGPVMLDGAASQREQVPRLRKGEPVPQRALSPTQSTHCAQLQPRLRHRFINFCVFRVEGFRFLKGKTPFRYWTCMTLSHRKSKIVQFFF